MPTSAALTHRMTVDQKEIARRPDRHRPTDEQRQRRGGDTRSRVAQRAGATIRNRSADAAPRTTVRNCRRTRRPSFADERSTSRASRSRRSMRGRPMLSRPSKKFGLRESRRRGVDPERRHTRASARLAGSSHPAATSRTLRAEAVDEASVVVARVFTACMESRVTRQPISPQPEATMSRPHIGASDCEPSRTRVLLDDTPFKHRPERAGVIGSPIGAAFISRPTRPCGAPVDPTLAD